MGRQTVGHFAQNEQPGNAGAFQSRGDLGLVQTMNLEIELDAGCLLYTSDAADE